MDKKPPAKYQDPKDTYRQAAMDATNKATEVAKPHYYGKIQGVHVFHATHEDHKALIGIHLHNAHDKDLNASLDEAKNKGFGTVVLHGSPPESLRTRIHPSLGAHKPGNIKKSEVAQIDLKKTFLQNDKKTVSSIEDHTASLRSTPKALMDWGVEKLTSLAKDATAQIELDGKIIKVRKLDADQYSGWIEHEGNKIHAFEHITLPELMTQLQSKLELYGREEQVTNKTKDDPEASAPDVQSRLEQLRDRIRGHLSQMGLEPEDVDGEEHKPFDETEVDEDKEKKDFDAAGKEKREKMAFGEQNEIEDQLKDLHQDLKEHISQDDVSLATKEANLDGESACPDCGSSKRFCECFSGLPEPRVEIDLKNKKINVFFKSEWGQEEKDAYLIDVRRRIFKIALRKMTSQ